MLKGFVFVYDFYGDVFLRIFKDLDIFIFFDDVEFVEQILEMFGYVFKEGKWCFMVQSWKWWEYYICYKYFFKKM